MRRASTTRCCARPRSPARPARSRSRTSRSCCRGSSAARRRPRRVEKTFMFTDIESSTNLVEALGDEVWQGVLRWHDETLRSLFAEHKGEEVVSTGDGFFVGFDSPDEALACAVAIQRRLAEHRRSAGFAPKVRIGAARVGGHAGRRGLLGQGRARGGADRRARGRRPDPGEPGHGGGRPLSDLGAADRDPARHVRADRDRDGRLGVSSEYDLVVIGGGPAGERGAAQAAYFGKRVAIVEREPEPGGAAVHTRHAALEDPARDRAVPVGLSAAAARRRAGRPGSRAHGHAAPRPQGRGPPPGGRSDPHQPGTRTGSTWCRARAALVDPHTVEVTSADGVATRLTAAVILVATGSSPYRPAGIPYDDDDVHDADGILRIHRLPRSMAVIGGGVIGCEYACMFAALGVRGAPDRPAPRPAAVPRPRDGRTARGRHAVARRPAAPGADVRTRRARFRRVDVHAAVRRAARGRRR